MICSGEVVNSIPKSYYGTIIIPYYKDEKSALVTKIVPYYVAVDDPSCRVCKHPKTAPPVKGWNFSASQLVENVANCTIIDNGTNSNSRIVTKFIKAPYNAALLLKHLNEELSIGIGVDPETYNNTCDLILVAMTDNSKHSEEVMTEDLGSVLSKGSISAVLEASGGHFDIYDGTKNVYLESKITLAIGPPKRWSFPKTDDNCINSVVPTGALAYPRFGIYTNCSPLYEIEVH
jgi:hypothetical protein